MSTPLEKLKIRNIGIYGLIRPAEVDDNLIPDGAVTEVQNFHFDRKGAATLRPGLTNTWGTVVIPTVGDLYNPSMGMFNAQSSFLLAGFRGSGAISYGLFSYNGEGWGRIGWAIGATTGSARIRFVDFSGRTAFMNGTYDSITFNSVALSYAAVSSTGNPLNLNQFLDAHLRASMGETYKSRLYLTGDADKTSRLFFSSVIDTNGNISWSPTIDYVDINPGDGEKITGLKRYSLELLIFKPNYIYRFRTAGLDPDPLIKIGTRSHESIVEGKKGMYFYHDTGFYRYAGGYPIEISRPISDFVEAIPFTQRDDIISWKDSDHIYWSLGNLTIQETKGASTWKNVVVRYTESSDVWTVYSYLCDVRAATQYVTANSISTVIGLDNGVVATQNSGTTDLGEPIKYRVVTKWYDFGNIAEQKVIYEMFAYAEKSREAVLMYQTDENVEWNEPTKSGQLKQLVTVFRSQTIKFRRIRFKLTGTNRNEATVFQGLEILEGINEGVVNV